MTERPTSVTDRRQRRSDQETRDLMLRAGRDLVARDGLTVSVDHLSFEDVIQVARVSRSAVYRLWPAKELYFRELLLQLARATDPNEGVYDPGTVNLAVTLAEEQLTEDWSPEARRRLLIELCRVGARQNFDFLRETSEWRTYVALVSTVASLSDPSQRDDMREAMKLAEVRGLDRMRTFYADMARVLGFRVRPQVPGGEFTFAVLGGSLVEGLVLINTASDALGSAVFEADPFGAGTFQQWTYASIGFTSIALSLTEDDPDYRLSSAEARALLNRFKAEYSRTSG